MHQYLFNFNDFEGRSVTVIFDPAKELETFRLEEALKDFHTYNEQCVHTVYIYPACRQLCGEDIRKEIATISNKNIEFVSTKPFQVNGLVIDSFTQQIFDAGLLNIIKSRHALLESDHNFHYVLPSGRHSPFFIRTGNILVRSSEINFVALILMSHVDVRTFSYIVCDTSSILQIPYAAAHLAQLFGQHLNMPFVSCGSYGLLDEFDFRPNSLVLISASNSGSLERKIRRKQHDVHVLTVLYNNSDGGKCLYNVFHVLNELLTMKSTSQFKSQNECGYCQQNSTAVAVRGEQFIPSKLTIQRVLFQKSHVPKWVNSFAKNVVEKRALFVNRAETVSAKRREIFLDLNRLLEANDGFMKSLEFCTPRSLDHFYRCCS